MGVATAAEASGKGVAAKSPEERAAIVARAAAAKAAKAAARRKSALRRDFLDADYWRRLAHKLGVRLPPWGEPATSTVVRKFLNQIAKSSTWYYGLTGFKSTEDFQQLNPDWPARAHCAILLEQLAKERGVDV